VTLRSAFLALGLLLPGFQAEEGFAPLFDGKTLSGWVVRDGPPGAFRVEDGALAGTPESRHPAWLSTEKAYENFDLRGEFFVKGWIDGGVYIHAPEHGRPGWCGVQVKIFHARDARPQNNSCGSLFPLLAPLKVNVKNQGEWNSLRILADGPQLRVWMNDELVQDADRDAAPELRHRLRRGFIGLSALGYPLRFRNLRLRELPSREKWEPLFETAEDFSKWAVSEGKPRFEPRGDVLRGEGMGHLATKEKYRDFELHLYVRGPRHHNGGILFRSAGKGLGGGRHYEIQLHNVEEAHYPTGSLYGFRRSAYPRIEDEKWFPLQLTVQGPRCVVRINGETVTEYDRLENLEEGFLELQAHQADAWLEYKRIRVRRL
jgi:hypothetical protein